MEGLVLVFLNTISREAIDAIMGNKVKLRAIENCQKRGATLVHLPKDRSTSGGSLG